MSYKVVELFSGKRGWSRPWSEEGHEVWTNDNDEAFDADSHADFLTLTPADLPFRPDVILASCPCESFSVGSFRHHWNAYGPCRHCGKGAHRISGEAWRHDLQTDDRDHPRYCRRADVPKHRLTFEPKSETGSTGQALLRHTLKFIMEIKPKFWVIENPRALMRQMPELRTFTRRTVTYCQYGRKEMKPTDLWGGFPPYLELQPPCNNGDPCHEAAPRGAKTGTQGLSTADAGEIPYALACAIRDAVIFSGLYG